MWIWNLENIGISNMKFREYRLLIWKLEYIGIDIGYFMNIDLIY